MGKTERTMEFIRPHYDARRRVLLICQRKTMVRSLEARTGDQGAGSEEPQLTCDEAQLELAKFGMKFDCYDTKECKGVISSTDHPRLICEYESLHRIQGKFDYIISDEFRSTASTMVASTNGERIAMHWETLKDLCNVALKVLFLDADMCVDSCAYKLQDVLMKSRMEFRMHALLSHFSQLDKAGKLTMGAEREFMVLRQFMQEVKEKHGCTCCGGEHAANGICRIENE
eukprot:9254-Heterococcus_DN1.PRE.1